ncbi:MAG: GerMN domain-containing protein [Candidatus Pacebacteria bacterium]|nr:GerMN domain-containing protein [Candidatus Paceibacterota bacterium]
MKKFVLFLILIILFFLILVFFYYKKIEYKKIEVNNFEECLKASGIVMESYPGKCRDSNGKVYVEVIKEEENNSLIKIDYPPSYALIESPLIIKGSAKGSWFFEASFPIELIDKNNNVIAIGIGMAMANSLTEDFVPFEAKLEFMNSEKKEGFLVFKNDNPSGLPENEKQIKIPVVINANQNLTKVKVYFANDNLDKDVTCSKVFPVERDVEKTEAIARTALEELFKGVNKKEEADSYRTALNPGIKINRLVITDGVANVDLSEELDESVGGSCRVSLIRKQIEETLKQFSNVKSVIISINGDSKYILQP